MAEYNISLQESEDSNSYDEEPVYYCEHCLSLRVKDCEGKDFCDVCGSTDIKRTNIKVWEQMYYKRYGKRYIHKTY